MSLFDLIFAQKSIVLGLGIVLLLLALALLLAGMGRLRKFAARRAKLRALRMAQMAARAAAAAQAAATAPQSAQSTAPTSMPATATPGVITEGKVVAVPQPSAQAASGAVSAPRPVVAPAQAQAAKPAPTGTSAANPAPVSDISNAISSEMQDILSSVFGNEEALEKLQILLRGLDNPPMGDILKLTKDIADQLRADNPARA